ncbi:5-dehydro-4-deoxyglucarate dehydratase [Clavibacter zhangzhiyongii]|uniref:Probable 5-dehydro-4-deoxyglucarate dehydratase n=1 Tax=Clavibacter zhangzhiyongii TaxID=2768071 RepID=A0A7L7Z0S1_9MICO|nr:5-dehydro-4-deoxyglucarate dehydratase [Clavibacter zhangzhiyongii]QOD43313.1 5-dehydro-4-deoxyglucarate dehydratase [Clavibacter zhangzhiyongii]
MTETADPTTDAPATSAAPAGHHPLPPLEGVLFFPVTPFDAADRVDEDVLARHVADGLAAGAGAAFVACGTGEFHALDVDEYAQAVRVAVAAAGGRHLVIAGAGGPLGHARRCARIAADAGADGLLVLPPYLVTGPQDGVAAYVEAVARATPLPVIAYHRGSATLGDAAVERLLRLPTLAGIKDGVGDMAQMQRFVLAARRAGRSDVRFFNGMLTAEASQAAYRAIGVPLYSSAVFAMAPRIALAFHAALLADDEDTQHLLLDGFFTPLVRLRDETPGFAVSLVKAGLRLRGVPVGSVRAPLVDPSPAQLAALERILARGEELVA